MPLNATTDAAAAIDSRGKKRRFFWSMFF